MLYSWQLLFQESPASLNAQQATSLRTSITPTKKVEMDRTIMPDGTIVTTVTTIQSRPKADCKLGEAAPQQASCMGGCYGSADLAMIFPRPLTQAVAKLFSHCVLQLQTCTLRGAFGFWVGT